MINYRLKPHVKVEPKYEFMKKDNFFYKRNGFTGRLEGMGGVLRVKEEDVYEVYRLYVFKHDDISKCRTSGISKPFADKSFVVIDMRHVIEGRKSARIRAQHNGYNYEIHTNDLREVDYLEETHLCIDPATYQPRYYRMKSLDSLELSSTYESRCKEIVLKRSWKFIDKTNTMGDITTSKVTIAEGYNVYKKDLVEFKLGDKDNRKQILWSETRRSTVHFINDYISHQIRVRYAMFDLPREGLSNVIIDSVAPRYLYQARFNPDKARELMNPPKTAVAISPWFAEIFGVKQMTAEQMCRILGYSKGHLTKLLNAVKEKQYKMMFIGYGGTNVSTIRNLDEISKLCNVINVFDRCTIFEPEDVEVSNLLRFPLNPMKVTVSASRNSPAEIKQLSNKLFLLGQQLKRISRNPVIEERSFYNVGPTSAQHPSSFHNAQCRLNADGSNARDEQGNQIIEAEIKSDKHIIYGAPGISTRQMLSKYGNFISATHGGNSCALHLNPEQDDSLQVESYGVIKLGGFHMNQLRMAIGLLETLADPEFNPQEMDKTLMDFAFTGSDQMIKNEDGVEKKMSLKTDVTYKFQLEHDGSIMTAEAADATLTQAETAAQF